MNDETTALTDAVRRLLATRLPTTALVADLGSPALRAAIDAGLDEVIGLADLLVSEADGGLGGTLSDAAAIARELGRACAPSSFLTSTVIAAPLTAELGQVHLGERVCLAVPWDLAPGQATPTATLSEEGTVTGSVPAVAGADGAGVLVVPVAVAGAFGLATVPAGATGVTLDAVVSLDQTRPLTDVSFEGAAVTVLATGAKAEIALRTALLRGRAVLASEQAGLAAWCLEATRGYLMQRRQFGRLIGSFQGIKHRMAYAWIDAESAGVAAAEAGDDTDPDHELLVAVAQSACSEIAFRLADECVQLHGGVGMTWEHPAHVFLKRALCSVSALGSPEHHRHVVADLVDLPA